MGALMQLQLDSRQIEHKDGSRGLSQRTLSMASEQLQSPPHGVLAAPSELGAGDATWVNFCGLGAAHVEIDLTSARSRRRPSFSSLRTAFC